MAELRRADSRSLFEEQPELLEIWSKNNDPSIDLASISKWQSSKKYLWNCDKGHEFESTPGNMSNGQRCPFCAGKRVLEGFNDLGCLDPEKAAFFDSDTNDFSVHEIHFGSSKKIAFTCPIGHKWNQSPRQFKTKSGCPVCKKRLIIPGVNDLGSTHPMLAAEYSDDNNLSLTELGSNSSKRVNWICKEGHKWPAVVFERAGGKGCPVCSNNTIVAGINDFASEHPELVGEWDFELNEKKPEQVASGSGYRAHWVCGRGHKWQTPVHRRSNGRGCIYCANRQVWPGFNDLETKFPEIAKEWDSDVNRIEPSQVLFGTHEKAGFRCSQGHQYVTTISRRTLSSSGCPVCIGFEVRAGVNDLLSQKPKLASRWSSKNSITPDQVYMNSSTQKYIFECEQGHEYKVAPQVASESYCPTCSNKEFEKGYNDLATVSERLASEFVSSGGEKDPTNMPSWSNQKAEWECQRGHKWAATIRDRMGGNDCPYCSNKRVWKGFNDLVALYPEVAKQWDYEKNESSPENVMGLSPKKFWWRCEKGHSYEQSLRNKVVRSYRCTICVNRQLLTGFNDLRTRFPELAAEWNSEKNGLPPEKVIFGSPAKAWWTCSAGHEWQAAPASRTRGVGCQSCNHGGFNPSAPANVYFLVNKELGARKVGIRGVDSSRLRNFQLIGWDCIKEFSFSEGTTARAVEKDFFIWLRQEEKLPAYLGSEDMEPFGGATETFSTDGPTNYEVQQKIENLIRHHRESS